jgi:hypothetical protein
MNPLSTADIARTHVLAAAVVATCLTTASLAECQVRLDRSTKESHTGKRSLARPVRTTLESPADEVVYFEETSPVVALQIAERETTEREHAIAELRRWRALAANWDGEGAAMPVASSLKAASAFACALNNDHLAPQPMLHTSGLAGLYWKTESLYADLEFLADGRVAYYVERGNDRHKGVVAFDGSNIPQPLEVFLGA